MRKTQPAYFTLNSYYQFLKCNVVKYKGNFKKLDSKPLLNDVKEFYSNSELDILKFQLALTHLPKFYTSESLLQLNEYCAYHTSVDCMNMTKDFGNQKNSGILKYVEGSSYQLYEEIKNLINQINSKFGHLRRYFKSSSILNNEEYILDNNGNIDEEKKANWDILSRYESELKDLHFNYKIPLRYKLIKFYFQHFMKRDFTVEEALKMGFTSCNCSLNSFTDEIFDDYNESNQDLDDSINSI